MACGLGLVFPVGWEEAPLMREASALHLRRGVGNLRAEKPMQEANTYIAMDLGAGSGRVMAVHTGGTDWRIEEIHRFENPGTDLPGGSFWNPVGLYRELVEGLRRVVASHGPEIAAIGIDTWGCDYALLDEGGVLLGMPHQYRDPRHEGMVERMHERMEEEELYRHTGVRTLFYNSSVHLLAERLRGGPALDAAAQLLFMPDLLAYWLCGRRAVERTIASTSQLYDPASRDWAWPVIRALGLPEKMFGPLVDPGTVLGGLRPELAASLGCGPIPVVASASHDTAAAVAGIPLEEEEPLWLSSGTWSILGVESPRAITGVEAMRHGFCNEWGAGGQVRFLKNISGLWLIQECRRDWAAKGRVYDYAEMAAMAEAAPAFSAWIDPDAPVFASPGDMPEKIRRFCAETGQAVPVDEGTVLRVATESLAMKVRSVYESVRSLTGRDFRRLHAGGGGSRNTLLCQAMADALGIEVVAGPVEATSCGNVLMQMIATGRLASLEEGRERIRSSFSFERYQPRQREAWERAWHAFRAIVP